MKKIILSFILSIFSFISIYACSCQGIASFCSEHSGYPNNNVFIGKILRHDSLFIEFSIIHNLRGTENRNIVKIYDSPPPVSSCIYDAKSNQIGNVGDSFLIVLPHIDSTYASNYWGTAGEYYRPTGICSEPIIPIINGDLVGFIVGTSLTHNIQIPQHISVNQFVNQYNSANTSNDCSIFVGIETVDASSFTVLPNPTTDFIAIDLDNSAQIVKTSLYSISGKLLFEATSYVNQVPLNEYANGIYFLQLELKNGEQLSRKVIKH